MKYVILMAHLWWCVPNLNPISWFYSFFVVWECRFMFILYIWASLSRGCHFDPALIRPCFRLSMVCFKQHIMHLHLHLQRLAVFFFSLFQAWSSIMYQLIPNVRELESNLARFAEIINADEVCWDTSTRRTKILSPMGLLEFQVLWFVCCCVCYCFPSASFVLKAKRKCMAHLEVGFSNCTACLQTLMNQNDHCACATLRLNVGH